MQRNKRRRADEKGSRSGKEARARVSNRQLAMDEAETKHQAESDEEDEDESVTLSERGRPSDSPRRRHQLPDSDSSSGDDASAAELDKLAHINSTLAEMASSDKKLSLASMKKRLQVNAALPAPLLAEYTAKGMVSVQAWRALKSRLDSRQQRKRDDERVDSEDESGQDEREERVWHDILDNLQGQEHRREEKMESEVPPTPSSQSSSINRQSPRRRASSTAASEQQPTEEDAVKLELVNEKLLEAKLSGERVNKETIRKQLSVSTYIINPLLAAFDKNGGRLNMAQWMAVKQQATVKRRGEQARRKRDLQSQSTLYQTSSSRHDSPLQLEQHEVDAIIASQPELQLSGSQESTSRASRLPTGEPLPEELDKMQLFNSVLGELAARGEQLKTEELRKRLHVSSFYVPALQALYRQNGVLTVEDWRDLRRQQSEQRSAEAFRQRQQAAAIELYKRAATAHRPTREERVEQRKREDEAAKETARLKKQRAEEETKRKAEAAIQKAREKEEKAKAKLEAEAAKQAKDEAKLAAMHAQKSQPQAEDDGLATESDSDREEQERLEAERRVRMKRLEEKRMKLEEESGDDDEEDWAGDSRAKVRSKKPLSSAKAEKAAASAAAAAAKKEEELQAKCVELNQIMTEWEQGGRQWTRDDMRKHLKVGGDFPGMILTEWKKKGVLSVEAWRLMRKKVSAQRQERRRRNGGDDAEPKPKAQPTHAASATNGAVSPTFHASSSHASAAHHKKKLKRTDSDNDLSFQHHSESALPATSRSLRRRRKVNYSAQLEEDPHTIVELTWYPTKSDQPFRIVIDPVVPAVMDVHAHCADVEIIGVLAGQWMADRRLLWVQSAYPCQQVGTDDDLTNVEIDPASLISVQETAEARGMRLVGWYHSHPYFRNQPSLVDVENQSRYQRMFGEAGSKHGGGSSKHGLPFIGGIITPYGKGEFKPLPSSIKWCVLCAYSTYSAMPHPGRTPL